MNDNNKFICPKAWKEIAISPTGLVTPCCVFEEPLKNDNDEFFHIAKDSLTDIWNSSSYRKIRKMMLEKKPISGCAQCYFQEKNSGKSKRLESFLQSEFLNETPRFDETNIDGSLNFGPVALDLKLGNKCNLACRMCQPKDSNFVAKQFKEIAEEENDFIFYQNTMPYDLFQNKSFEDIGTWSEEKFFIKQFKSIQDNITDLQIAGGEPLLQDEFYEIINSMIESGQAKNCNLFISTNMSSLSNKVSSFLDEFKTIHWGISVDAYGDELEYVRYPLKWSRFNNNLQTLSEMISTKKNNFASLCLTAQAFNVLTLDKLLEFYFSDFIKYFKNNSFNLSVNSVTYPEHLAYTILPESIKQVAKSRIQPFVEKAKQIRSSGSMLGFEGLTQICSVLESDEIQPDIELCSSLLNYSASLDKKRNQKMSEYLPELDKALKSYVGTHQSKRLFNKATMKSYGWVKKSEKKFEEAKKIFLDVVRNADDFESYQTLGELYNDEKSYQESISFYEKAFKLMPKDINLIKTIGWVYKRANLLDKSLEKFELALALDATDESSSKEIDYLKKKIHK